LANPEPGSRKVITTPPHPLRTHGLQ
jgi:hypothetical protein